MKAVFQRKVPTIAEFKHTLSQYTPEELKKYARDVVIVKEVELTDREYTNFGERLFENQAWIKDEDAGYVGSKEKVIKVTNKDNGDSILVRSEGYNYPRYVGIPI